jgi:general secretion pathway protein C
MAHSSALKLNDPKALPRLALMAASGLLLLTAGWHGQRLFKASGTTGQVDAVQAPTAIVSAPADLTTLSQWEPYGAAAQANAADAAAPEVVAPSPLNLQLRGTVAEENGEGGEAIIADEAGLERSYAVGDSIADGVVLHAIRHREVVIKRGEQLESVAMPAIPSSGGGEVPPLPEVTNIPITTATPEPPAPAPAIPTPAPAPAPGVDSPPSPPDAGIPAPPPPDMSVAPPPEALPPGNQ